VKILAWHEAEYIFRNRRKQSQMQQYSRRIKNHSACIGIVNEQTVEVMPACPEDSYFSDSFLIRGTEKYRYENIE